MTGNIFADIPSALPEELIQRLLDKPGLRIERIVSRGHASPEGFWYDQDEDEWVVLLAGHAGLQFENEKTIRDMKPGDTLLIPAGCRHRVAWTDTSTDTIWLAVFFH